MTTNRNDEAEIRSIISECTTGASVADLERVRPHLAEDVVYLLAGEAPLRGPDAFLALLRTLLSAGEMKAEVEIRELQLMGDHAYTLNWLSLTLVPKDGGQPRRRSGHTFTLLRRKPAGGWEVYRNLNLLTEL